MKKLIAISVVFALVAGVAFAVDLGGTVIGTVKVIKADSASSAVTAGGGMNRVRLEGSGEVSDGQFGGWIRFDTASGAAGSAWTNGFMGYAWWKPIDQLKLTIGKFSDGFFEQNGNACWGFYQTATDTGVAMEGSNAWGWGPIAVGPNIGGNYRGGFRLRQAFNPAADFGGLFIAITPVDMVEINIGIPFIDKPFRNTPANLDIGDIFKATFAQVALNMSFGTIAFTFEGDQGDADAHRDPDLLKSQIFGFFALKAIDNLQIDFGLGTNFDSATNADRLNIGLAVKYAPGSWGIKFRSMFAIPVSGGQKFGMLFDILPYFVINDSFRAYVSGGVSIYNIDNIGQGGSWHVNPYIEVGEEWGAKFLAGIKVYQKGDISSGSTAVNFEIPVALIVSF